MWNAKQARAVSDKSNCFTKKEMQKLVNKEIKFYSNKIKEAAYTGRTSIKCSTDEALYFAVVNYFIDKGYDVSINSIDNTTRVYFYNVSW